MKLDLTPLENAIDQLGLALDDYNSEFALAHPRLKWHIRDSAIQAFEFTYELSFKMLRPHLELASPSPAEIDKLTFNATIREGFRQDLVKSELRDWQDFRAKRGTTSHTYDEAKAQEVFDGIPKLLAEAQFLLGRLQERNESLE